MKTVVKTYLALAIIGGIAFVLSLFLGISPCVIYLVVGLPCPACGLTRAFISLLWLDIWQSLAYHPLLILVPFVPLLMLDRIPHKWRNILAFAVLAIFVVTWIIRMVLLFPDTPPLDRNHDSVFSRLFQ